MNDFSPVPPAPVLPAPLLAAGDSGSLTGPWGDEEAVALLRLTAGLDEAALLWRRDPAAAELVLARPILGLELRAATVEGLAAAVEHLAWQTDRLLIAAQARSRAADLPAADLLARALARLLAAPSAEAPPGTRFVPVGGFGPAASRAAAEPLAVELEDHRTIFQR